MNCGTTIWYFPLLLSSLIPNMSDLYFIYRHPKPFSLPIIIVGVFIHSSSLMIFRLILLSWLPICEFLFGILPHVEVETGGAEDVAPTTFWEDLFEKPNNPRTDDDGTTQLFKGDSELLCSFLYFSSLYWVCNRTTALFKVLFSASNSCNFSNIGLTVFEGILLAFSPPFVTIQLDLSRYYLPGYYYWV